MGRPTREKGFALILALWSIALFAAAAGYGLQQSLKLSDDLRIEMEIAHARMALHAGEAIARDRIRIAAETGDDPTGSYQTSQGAFDIIISIEDEAKKLNPNDASPEVLSAVLQEMGANAAEANEMAERIADYLDRDDQPRRRGAEAPQYARAGLAAPKNAPIRNLEELWGVLGFTDFADRLGPATDTSKWLSLAGRANGRYDFDQNTGALILDEASPDAVGGPFLVRISAKRSNNLAVRMPDFSAAQSKTVQIYARLR